MTEITKAQYSTKYNAIKPQVEKRTCLKMKRIIDRIFLAIYSLSLWYSDVKMRSVATETELSTRLTGSADLTRPQIVEKQMVN